MKRRSNVRWLVVVPLVLIALAVAPLSRAQETGQGMGSLDPAQLARSQRIAEIEGDLAAKAAFVNEMLEKFAEAAAAKGYDAYWQKGQRNLLARSAEQLLKLSERATDFDTFDKLVFQGYTVNDFGDLTQDLVFFPLAPCRLLDTRGLTNTAPYQGPKAPGTEVAFSVNDSLAVQGGNAAGCGVPSADPPALAVVVTAAPTNTGQGNLRAYPTLGTIPTASLVNYEGGVVVAGGAIVQSGSGMADELTVRNQGAGTTHIVVDVTGYFHAPNATAVDNQVLTTVTAIAASTAFTVNSPACPAGWRLTGGGMLSQFFGQIATFAGVRPDATSGTNVADNYVCQGTTSATAGNITCYAVCARVPGR